MALSIHQKSVYLIIFNATMVLRSVGKTLKKKGIKEFKIKTFKEIEKLTRLMDDGKLTEKQILNSIRNLASKFKISFGQAQKPINVLLKYHFHLFHKPSDKIKKELYCPIDSVILKELKIKVISLTKIDEKQFFEIQKQIQNISETRIDFDTKWDKKHLKDEGILN